MWKYNNTLTKSLFEKKCGFVKVVYIVRFLKIHILEQIQEQASHLTRPTSSQFIHFKATNSAVKWFRCTLFLDPLQILQGRRRNPPQTWHVVHASGLWNFKYFLKLIMQHSVYWCTQQTGSGFVMCLPLTVLGTQIWDQFIQLGQYSMIDWDLVFSKKWFFKYTKCRLSGTHHFEVVKNLNILPRKFENLLLKNLYMCHYLLSKCLYPIYYKYVHFVY